MSVFNRIKNGLEEAIAYEKGTGDAKVTTISVQPVAHFDPEEIKNIRKKAGLTQVIFAEFMGVSVKTIEAWESGRNHPIGSACRLLYLTQEDPLFPQKTGIVTR